MPAFHYRIARPDGAALEGWTEGESEQAVRAQLEGQGCLVFGLRRQGGWSVLPKLRLPRRRRVSAQDALIFNQELLALIKAGIPMLRAVDLVIDRTRHPAFQEALRAVRQDIRGGASLAEALSRHPAHFPEVYVASIRAGEQSGNLPDVFLRYIDYLKLLMDLRQKMMKALTYPAFLVVVGLGVVAFLLSYVLPTFSAVYGESASELPAATKGLIAFVHAMQAHLPVVAVAAAAAAGGLYLWARSPAGRLRWDRWQLRLPLLGQVLSGHHTIQFARTLATILDAGIPLVHALPTVRDAVSNRFLLAHLAAATERVREGAPLSAALAEREVLPRLAVEMIAVGEETGSLAGMLRDVAGLFEVGLGQRLSQLTTWLEPALLLVMGVIVGSIVIIMYLPVFQMAGAIH